jgi:hypothetical protein
LGTFKLDGKGNLVYDPKMGAAFGRKERRSGERRVVLTRIKIFGRALTAVEAEAVAGLVAEAGCAADQIDVVTSIGKPDVDSEDEVILLLGTPSTCGDADLENDLAQALNAGSRVIWIWPKDAEAGTLPVAAAKYSYSVIPWNPEKLRAVAADDDVMCFESPIGDPLPKVRPNATFALMKRPRSIDHLLLCYRARFGLRAEPVPQDLYSGLLQAEDTKEGEAGRSYSWHGRG